MYTSGDFHRDVAVYQYNAKDKLRQHANVARVVSNSSLTFAIGIFVAIVTKKILGTRVQMLETPMMLIPTILMGVFSFFYSMAAADYANEIITKANFIESVDIRTPISWDTTALDQISWTVHDKQPRLCFLKYPFDE